MNEIIENRKKSEVLAEKINELNYGDVITHQQIASIIEEDYPSNKYTSTIAKARKLLLKKYNKTIENITGDGYRLVNPDDFVQQSLKHYKRGFTEMQKGYDTLTYAPTKDMTKEGREAYRRVHDRAITLAATMKGASVELRTLGQKKHPMALENIKK
jgi:DNA-binding winged helix-turn-helix (wHTH) protein